jgi:hypothetical protein
MQASANLRFKIEDEDFFLLRKYDFFGTISFCIFEKEFHTHFLKIGNFLQNNSFVHREVIVIFKFFRLNSFQYKQLILLLLIHD